MSTLESEVVLQTQLTSQTEVIIVFCGQEGEFSIDANGIRHGETDTCFTRELSIRLFTVLRDDSRTCLDIE